MVYFIERRTDKVRFTFPSFTSTEWIEQHRYPRTFLLKAFNFINGLLFKLVFKFNFICSDRLRFDWLKIELGWL